jgi:Uma2 family endonuclease
MRDRFYAFEASSNVKHEYLDGQIYAMAGGTPEHAALAAAVVGQLYAQLREGRCRVYNSDLRVRVPATGLLTYPDATVMWGPRQRDAEDEYAITNPTLIVEVLSRSTEEYDRGDKFEHCKRSSSLRE